MKRIEREENHEMVIEELNREYSRVCGLNLRAKKLIQDLKKDRDLNRNEVRRCKEENEMLKERVDELNKEKLLLESHISGLEKEINDFKGLVLGNNVANSFHKQGKQNLGKSIINGADWPTAESQENDAVRDDYVTRVSSISLETKFKSVNHSFKKHDSVKQSLVSDCLDKISTPHTTSKQSSNFCLRGTRTDENDLEFFSENLIIKNQEKSAAVLVREKPVQWETARDVSFLDTHVESRLHPSNSILKNNLLNSSKNNSIIRNNFASDLESAKSTKEKLYFNTTRGKENRKKLNGFGCTECDKTCQHHSKHRSHCKMPETPPGFWDL